MDAKKRIDGRAPSEVRPIRFERRYTQNAPGSVLASFGDTRVICTASWTEGVPSFLVGRGKGWLTAEYSMLPASTPARKSRDRAGKTDGRSVEIQRLIGRALRSVVELNKMTERTLWIDCDVLQADGGTRTVAISGAFVALHDALMVMQEKRLLRAWPLRTQLGAVSVGVVQGEPMCDLNYAEDSQADVDMNLVMTGEGEFVEVQGSAEGATFSREKLDKMLALGEAGIRTIQAAQTSVLEG
ncbi:MAG: ribonuclease PH [Planctomycetes bacterium]|jgi:ribonuclease PH|nr:ribonuclease PH [Planctomycetota bacterium]